MELRGDWRNVPGVILERIKTICALMGRGVNAAVGGRKPDRKCRAAP